MLADARTEGRQSHRAIDKPPSTAGMPLRSRSRIGTAGASLGTEVAACIHTTYWGLLKQPDNQKMASALCSVPRRRMPPRLEKVHRCKSRAASTDPEDAAEAAANHHQQRGASHDFRVKGARRAKWFTGIRMEHGEQAVV